MRLNGTSNAIAAKNNSINFVTFTDNLCSINQRWWKTVKSKAGTLKAISTVSEDEMHPQDLLIVDVLPRHRNHITLIRKSLVADRHAY